MLFIKHQNRPLKLKSFQFIFLLQTKATITAKAVILVF